MVNRSQGDASRFLKVLDAYDTSKEVTQQRLYLETLEEVFQGMKKVIVDERGGPGVVPYLPLGELRPGSSAAEPGSRSSAGGGGASQGAGSSVGQGGPSR